MDGCKSAYLETNTTILHDGVECEKNPLTTYLIM